MAEVEIEVAFGTDPTHHDSATLKEVLSNAATALESIQEQIDALTARIASRREQIATCEQDVQISAHELHAYQGRIADVETRLVAAQTSARVSAGTPAEASTKAHTEALQKERDELHAAHEEASKAHRKLEASKAKEQSTLLKELEQAGQERDTLEETERQLQASRLEAHKALGEAICHEIASEMQIYRQREEQLQADLAACRTATRMVQVGIPDRLRGYPELLPAVQRSYGAPPVPTDPTPLQKILTASLALADVLSGINSIKGVYTPMREISPDKGVSYLAELLNPELLKLLLKQSTQEDCKRILDGRVEALRLWLSDHEADLKRASMRATSREDEQEITRMRERVKAQFGLG